MKSIEQVIPYNQMARHNLEIEKYRELERCSNFIEPLWN